MDPLSAGALLAPLFCLQEPVRAARLVAVDLAAP